eukprot:2609954-Lingulodinium_polyedra.AAC.1
MVPKFRLIDDYSEVGHNDAADLRETIEVDTVDSSIAICRCWAQSIRGLRMVGMPGLEAARWEEHDLELVGFLQDLKAAYRQVPRRESQRHFFTVLYYDSAARDARVAEHYAQPFGARVAVLNFNRLGRALKAIFV